MEERHPLVAELMRGIAEDREAAGHEPLDDEELEAMARLSLQETFRNRQAYVHEFITRENAERYYAEERQRLAHEQGVSENEVDEEELSQAVVRRTFSEHPEIR